MVNRMPRVAAVVKFNSLLVQENVDFHLMDVGASREAAGLRDQVVIELNHRYRPDLIIGSTLKAAIGHHRQLSENQCVRSLFAGNLTAQREIVLKNGKNLAGGYAFKHR